MRILNKIFLGLGLLGCVGALVAGILEKIEFGTWGIVALVAGAVVFAALMALPGIIKIATELFDVSYDKESGLKIREEK
jgi:hypothetical protein